MAPLFRHETGRLHARLPVSGLASLRLSADRVAFVLVVLGATTFDGFSGSELWGDLVGSRSGWELTIVNTLGLVWLVGLVGYVGGVLVAHDKAMETGDAASAVRSQYPMLAVMVL